MAMELTNINVPAQDSDAETPPMSATNGAFKRRHCVFAAPPPPAVSYRECMRNHAAGIGGHAVDGCCEFMPSPESDSGESLRCAACGCHRNFHRRDPDDPAPLQLHRHLAPPPDSAPPATRSFYSSHHVSLKKTFSPAKTPPPAAISPVAGGRKRFRTRFSQEQKEKMYGFSEKLGWKLQKIDKGLIEEFCKEIGVGKEVLKVWMHNNKSTLGRREIGGGNVNGGIIDGDYKSAGDRVEEKLAGNGNGNGNGGPHNGGVFKPVCVGPGDGSSSSSG